LVVAEAKISFFSVIRLSDVCLRTGALSYFKRIISVGVG
jgi:hypothetical protein